VVVSSAGTVHSSAAGAGFGVRDGDRGGRAGRLRAVGHIPWRSRSPSQPVSRVTEKDPAPATRRAAGGQCRCTVGRGDGDRIGRCGQVPAHVRGQHGDGEWVVRVPDRRCPSLAGGGTRVGDLARREHQQLGELALRSRRWWRWCRGAPVSSTLTVRVPATISVVPPYEGPGAPGRCLERVHGRRERRDMDIATGERAVPM